MKKRYIATFVSLLLIVAMAMSLGGCGDRFMKYHTDKTMEKQMSTAEKRKEEALAYLNDRYDDEFIPEGYMAKNWAYDYEMVTFTPKKYPDDAVEVKFYEEDGKIRITDDYHKCYMREDATQYFQEIVERYITPYEVKVDIENEELPENLKTLDFGKLVASKTCDVQVYIATQTEVDDGTKLAIVQAVADNKIMGFIDFFVISEQSVEKQYSINDIIHEHNEEILSHVYLLVDRSFKIETF